MNKHIVSALVYNRSGVLTKISGLFSRRGYNIDSLTVCNTEEKDYSRMTIVVYGDDYILAQITKQLDKLHDVKKVMQLSPSNSVLRELLIIKVDAPTEKRSQIFEVATIYKAKVIDLSPQSLIMEMTGEPDKIDAFINVVNEFGIKEMARTGITCLTRGDSCIKDLKDYNEDVI